jgi:hypothetical protein
MYVVSYSITRDQCYDQYLGDSDQFSAKIGVSKIEVLISSF